MKDEVPQFQSSRIKDATSRNRDPIDTSSGVEKESNSEDDRSVDQRDSKAIKAISSFGLGEIKREANDNEIRGDNTYLKILHLLFCLALNNIFLSVLFPRISLSFVSLLISTCPKLEIALISFESR